MRLFHAVGMQYALTILIIFYFAFNISQDSTMVLAHNLSIKRTDDIKINNEATFQTMMLSKSILDGLTSAGFYKPSPIQLLGIPLGKLGLGT